MKRALIVQHAPLEGPGAVAEWLALRGFFVWSWFVFRGEAQPCPSEAEGGPFGAAGDLIVLMGGPMGVYETDRYPWLEPEITWLRGLLPGPAAILGICLGSQLLAAALGAPVAPQARKEIGLGPVTFDPDAPAPAPAGQTLTVFHWHGDTYPLPRGCRPLGSSPATACQGFVYGQRIWGLQFHPEITPHLAEVYWADPAGQAEIEAERARANPFVQNPEELRPRLPELQPARDWLFRLLDALTGGQTL